MMIAYALFAIAVALELFLFIGKDAVLKSRRREGLEESLRQAHADLKEARQRIEARRAALLAAVDAADRQRTELAETDKAFARSQKTSPTLVHTIGEPGTGIRFRATISKRLAPAAEPSLKLIWDCQNYIDVWASEIEAAKNLAAAQFPSKHDYSIGEFAAMPESQPSSAHEHAA
jgi:septal ring factor EnvC (AmiA/AmiB activator)